MQDQVIVTGVKPTGIPHLGNYVGAIKPALELAASATDAFLFVADYHALNQVHDPAALDSYTVAVAATFLALGLDPDRTVFYRQSDVPETLELTTILSAVTPKGFMNRAHAYKAEVDRNTATGKKDVDAGINMGLYTYPILMAADILQFQADLVPVGKDQTQHVEFARDIAGHFNALYGDVLKLPGHLIQPTAAAIPGLDGRKMSKSYGNTIPLFSPAKDLRKLVKRIVTDSRQPDEPKDPEASTIFQLYTQFASPEQVLEMRDAFIAGGMAYGTAKEALFEAIDAVIAGPRERFDSLIAEPRQVWDLLERGADTARATARQTLRQVKTAAGIRPFSGALA